MVLDILGWVLEPVSVVLYYCNSRHSATYPERHRCNDCTCWGEPLIFVGEGSLNDDDDHRRVWKDSCAMGFLVSQRIPQARGVLKRDEVTWTVPRNVVYIFRFNVWVSHVWIVRKREFPKKACFTRRMHWMLFWSLYTSFIIIPFAFYFIHCRRNLVFAFVTSPRQTVDCTTRTTTTFCPK